MEILKSFKRKDILISQDFMTLQGNNTVRKQLTIESDSSKQQKLNKKYLFSIIIRVKKNNGF